MHIDAKAAQILIDVYAHPTFNPGHYVEIEKAHTLLKLKKGEMLLEAGKTLHAYYIMVSGLARSYVINYDMDEITTAFHLPGTIAIDVVSIFKQQPAETHIQAVSDLYCWEIKFDAFQKLFSQIPGFSDWGRNWMTEQLFKLQQRNIDIITKSASERYHTLESLYPQILIDAPLKQIASFLGITDTSFSRLRRNALSKQKT